MLLKPINNDNPDDRIDTRDLHYGKFDSGLAVYLYEAMLLNGDDGNAYVSSPEGSGDWANRFGRRILSGDDRGFIYAATFPTVDEARAAFEDARWDIDPYTCDECDEPVARPDAGQDVPDLCNVCQARKAHPRTF